MGDKGKSVNAYTRSNANWEEVKDERLVKAIPFFEVLEAAKRGYDEVQAAFDAFLDWKADDWYVMKAAALKSMKEFGAAFEKLIDYNVFIDESRDEKKQASKRVDEKNRATRIRIAVDLTTGKVPDKLADILAGDIEARKGDFSKG